MNRDTVRRKVDEARRVVTTRYRRRLLLLCFIALALAAAIILVVFLQHGKGGPVCDSDECKKIAKEIYANLDTSVDPCDNFYEFACGGWKKRNPRPNDAIEWSRFAQMRQTVRRNLHSILSEESEFKEPFAFKQARKLYKSCTNFEKRDSYGIQGLRNIFKALKIFPLIGEKAESFNISKAIVYIHKHFPFIESPFIEFLSRVNETTNQTVIELYPPINTNFARDYWMFFNNRTERVKIEIERVNTFKKAISVFKSSTNDMEIAQEVEKVVNLETTLIRSAYDYDDENDRSETIPLSLVGRKFPGFDWKYIFTQILGKEITETTLIKIDTQNLNFYEKLGPSLLEQPKEVSANLLGLQILNYLGRSVVFKLDEIFENQTLTTEKKQEDCVGFVEDFLEKALTKMYLESMLDQGSLRRIRESVSQIKKALTITFFESDWMDDQTKIKAQLKLNKMMDIIGDAIENDTLISNQNDMESFDTENFFSNYIKASIWERNRKGNTRRRNHGSITVVNAFYTPRENEIIVKPGFLTPPAYYLKGPSAMNFGTLGTVIGHEMTHGFDTDGSMFDEKGEYKRWWKNETLDKFNEKVQCFVEQYSNFTEPVTGRKINGQLTIGDNIADNGGVRQAFKAYKLYKALYNASADIRLPDEMDKFDGEQLFFISFANIYCENHSKDYLQLQLQYDAHSPNVARIIVPLQNMEEFSKTFKCKKGTAMNPTNKCVLW